jgi:hypothetical protein
VILNQIHFSSIRSRLTPQAIDDLLILLIAFKLLGIETQVVLAKLLRAVSHYLLLVAKTLNTTVEYLMTGKKSLQKSENQDPIAGKLLNYINGLDHDRLVETEAILTFYNGLTLQPEILTQGGKQNRKEA